MALPQGDDYINQPYRLVALMAYAEEQQESSRKDFTRCSTEANIQT